MNNIGVGIGPDPVQFTQVVCRYESSDLGSIHVACSLAPVKISTDDRHLFGVAINLRTRPWFRLRLVLCSRIVQELYDGLVHPACVFTSAAAVSVLPTLFAPAQTF